MRRYILILFALMLAVAGLTPSVSQAQGQGRYDYRYGPPVYRLTDWQYQRMRSLSRQLRDQTRHLSNEARNGARYGRGSEAHFLNSIQSLADQAADFHTRILNYRGDWDVARDVQRLDFRTHRIYENVRDSGLLRNTYDEFNDVLRTIGEMNRVLGLQGRGYPGYGYRDHFYPSYRPSQPYRPYPGQYPGHPDQYGTYPRQYPSNPDPYRSNPYFVPDYQGPSGSYGQ